MSNAPATVPASERQGPPLEGLGSQLDRHEAQHRSGGECEREWQQGADLLDQGVCHERTDGLRRAGQHGSPELLPRLEAGGLHRNRNARSLWHVLKRDRQDHKQPEALGLGGERGPDCESLRQAVDQEHAEHEHRPTHACAAELADVDVAVRQQLAGDQQECDPGREPRRHRRFRTLIQRRQEQTDNRGHGHQADRNAPQGRTDRRGVGPESRYRQGAHAGCQRGPAAGQSEYRELHARAYSIRPWSSA